MAVIFLDNFNGTGALGGHVPDLALGSMASWVKNTGHADALTLSGGFAVSPTSFYDGPLYDIGTQTPDLTGITEFDITWSITAPAAFISPYPQLNFTLCDASYGSSSGFGFNYIAEYDAAAGGLVQGVTGTPPIAQVAAGAIAVNGVYPGTFSVRLGVQTLTWLGHTYVWANSNSTPTPLNHLQMFLTSGLKLDYLQISIPGAAPPLWTDFQNTYEVI